MQLLLAQDHDQVGDFFFFMPACAGLGISSALFSYVSFLPRRCSHPYFYRKVARGILQFTLLKPVLAAIKIILVACGVYDDGDFDVTKGYLYVSLIDNVSITVSLYCLVSRLSLHFCSKEAKAPWEGSVGWLLRSDPGPTFHAPPSKVLFYMATKRELEPYRPMSKFLCIKAVIFFAFWQGIIIAGLVRIQVIHDVGDWTSDNVATGAQDFLICIEMFIAAIAHLYAFSSKEFESMLSSTLPFKHALKDVFSVREG